MHTLRRNSRRHRPFSGLHILGVYVFGSGDVCRDTVIGFYLANEGISILENAAELGLPLPKKLIAILAQLRSKNDDEDDKEEKGECEIYKNRH